MKFMVPARLIKQTHNCTYERERARTHRQHTFSDCDSERSCSATGQEYPLRVVDKESQGKESLDLHVGPLMQYLNKGNEAERAGMKRLVTVHSECESRSIFRAAMLGIEGGEASGGGARSYPFEGWWWWSFATRR